MPPLRKRNWYGIRKFRFPNSDWCGPGWSDGKWVSNRCGYATARSYNDQVCKEHDCDIAAGHTYADHKFYQRMSNPIIGAAPYVAHTLENYFYPENKLEMPKRSAATLPPTPTKYQRLGVSSSYTQTPTYRQVSANAAAQTQSYGVSTHRIQSAKRVNNRVSHSKGVQLMFENGAVASHTPDPGENIPQVLYIGHTTSQYAEQGIAVWCMLLKSLFQKHGMDVKNLADNFLTNDNANNDYIVRVYYSYSDSGAQALTVASNSLYTMANFIHTNLVSVNEKVHFQNIAIIDRKDTTQLKLETSLNLERVVMHMTSISSLTIQNTTPSNTGSTSTDVTGTNPLHYKYYKCSQPNFIVVGSQTGLGAQSNALFGLQSLGIANNDQLIKFYDTDPSETYWADILVHPPAPKHVEGCKSSNSSILQPGATVTSNVMYKSSFYLDTYYNGNNETTNDTNRLKFGRCAVFAFDKLLDSRVENVAPTVTWEIENNIIVNMSMKKKAPTQPFKRVIRALYPAALGAIEEITPETQPQPNST